MCPLAINTAVPKQTYEDFCKKILDYDGLLRDLSRIGGVLNMRGAYSLIQAPVSRQIRLPICLKRLPPWLEIPVSHKV